MSLNSADGPMNQFFQRTGLCGALPDGYQVTCRELVPCVFPLMPPVFADIPRLDHKRQVLLYGSYGRAYMPVCFNCPFESLRLESPWFDGHTLTLRGECPNAENEEVVPCGIQGTDCCVG